MNILNTDNCTCGHGAAFYKNVSVLELLLDSKLDPSVKDISGKNILHLLCKDPLECSSSINEELESKFIQLVERLIKEFKIDINSKDLTEFTYVLFKKIYKHLIP